MMGLSQLNFEGRNRIDVAIMRLREFEPPEGYYFADSYGKDSCVTRHLLQAAGSKYDGHYHKGGIDPPELVRFGKKHHPEIIISRPPMSVWKAVETKGMPRRKGRWCCELIKEKAGSGRRVVTGIRWQESATRRIRRMFEVCVADDTKYFLHPIIDWTANDVWEYIRANDIPYCSLYDEGARPEQRGYGKGLFKRLGCMLCPMITPRQTQIELIRFPKIAEAWRRSCFKYWEEGHKKPRPKDETKLGVYRWDTPEAMWKWWISRKSEPKVSDAQCIMFDN